MKVQISVTLIICGTILMLAPHIYSVAQTFLVAEVMADLSKEISFSTGVKKSYQLICIVSGILMILAGIIGSIWPRPQNSN